MKKVSTQILALGVLAAVLPAQRDLAAGFSAQSLVIDLDAATGERGSLGVTHLNGEIFTSTRISPGVGGLHFVTVFDGTGNKLRSWFQPGFAQASEWGFRDGSTDGKNLLFGFELGIEIVDVDGLLLNGFSGPNLQTGNGPVTVIGGLISGNVLSLYQAGISRALAYDLYGDGGDGSFWTGNFGSSIFEINLAGDVITTHPNSRSVSYGFGLDPVSRSTPTSPATRMWINSAPNVSGVSGTLAIAEYDLTTGTLTGQTMRPIQGVQGGLDIIPGTLGRGPTASGYDILHLQQGGPDEVRIRRLYLDVAGTGVPPSPVTRLGTREPDLLNTVDDEALWPLSDRGVSLYTIASSSLEMIWDLSRDPGDGTGNGGLNGTPAVIFVNIGPDAVIGLDATSNLLGIRELAHLQPLLTTPLPQFAVRSRGMLLSNDPLLPRSEWIVSLTPGMPFQAIGDCVRAQGLWLDTDVAFLPFALSNQTRFCRAADPVVLSGTYGVMLGNNTFNADCSAGYWQLINEETDPDLSIVRFTLTVLPRNIPMPASTQVLVDNFFRWDTDSGGLACCFAGGNSQLGGCGVCFQGGSAITTGLIFAGTPISACDPNAMQGWVGSDPATAAYGCCDGDFLTLTFRFTPDTFMNDVRFEFDCDTDGGVGVYGNSMAGVVYEVEFKNGSVSTAVAVADANIPFRAFVQL